MYKNKSKLKESKAITLIALLITIVVLIILAGVAINLTLGQNGIFNKAKEAKRMQLEAEYKEKIGTDLLAAQIDAIARNEELEDEQVKDIISNYGELQEDGDTIKIKDKDIEVSLSDIYTGTTTSNGSYTENKAKIAMLEKRIKELQEQLDNIYLSGDEKNKKIAELNSKITELEKQKTELETKVESLEKDKKDLENNVTTLQQGKTELSNQVTNLKNEKERIVGAWSKKGLNINNNTDIENIINSINNISTESKISLLQYGTGQSGYTASKDYKAIIIVTFSAYESGGQIKGWGMTVQKNGSTIGTTGDKQNSAPYVYAYICKNVKKSDSFVFSSYNMRNDWISNAIFGIE